MDCHSRWARTTPPADAARLRDRRGSRSRGRVNVLIARNHPGTRDGIFAEFHSHPYFTWVRRRMARAAAKIKECPAPFGSSPSILMAPCSTTKVQLSEENRAALRRAHEAGIEIVLGTGRRHKFALPIAEPLGFDLWLISSNGAVTRSITRRAFSSGPAAAADRPQAVPAHARLSRLHGLTFDREGLGAIVCENHERLYGVIQRWMEKNSPYIEYHQSNREGAGRRIRSRLCFAARLS